MLREKTLRIIGGGNMGFAIARALKNKMKIVVIDREASLTEKYQKEGIKFQINDYRGCKESDYLMLAVKPQASKVLAAEIKGEISSHSILISIMAGTSMSTLEADYQAKKIVRVMPNMPALQGAGMNVWTANRRVNSQEREIIREILSATGEEIFVAQEEGIDAATAISGSGPAYFFLFLEALRKASLLQGFSEEEARKMVLQTAAGSIEIARHADFNELIRQVKSPGGTTEKALEIFEQKGLTDCVVAATKAARKRAEEISRHEF